MIDNFFKQLLAQVLHDSLLLTVGVIVSLILLETIFFYIRWYNNKYK